MSELNAVVTGGAVRIGRAIALRMAVAGWNVCIHYGQSEREAKQTVSELELLGVKATCVPADLNQPVSAAKQVFQHASDKLGAVSCLINNAAIFREGTLASTTELEWDAHFETNVKAPFFLSQEFARQCRKGGSIINLIDWRGTHPVPGHVAYAQTKSALVAQTRLLAQELGPDIRVNGIAPGAILPPPGKGQEVLETRAVRNPLRRVGAADDITRTVMFLLESPFITGEIVHVSGGEHLAAGKSYGA
ncbi:MAG: SDR family oxidoreductase [Planctomycetaceae bacterium]|nr:SDR family oxidoreductase [Planctomycetaceae bacterium]MCB9953522.1 SDR family oxidoreductase [Planctomycetaceae bacterium]